MEEQSKKQTPILLRIETKEKSPSDKQSEPLKSAEKETPVDSRMDASKSSEKFEDESPDWKNWVHIFYDYINQYSWMKIGYQLVMRYFQDGVAKSSAALAYYLLFSIFPILIVISNIIGLANIDLGVLDVAINRIFPSDVMGLIANYFVYAQRSSSPIILSFSAIFSIYFPTRAVKVLMDSTRKAYRLPKPDDPILYKTKQFLFTLFLLIVVASILLMSSLGQKTITFLMLVMPKSASFLSTFTLDIWKYIRYGIIGFLMLMTLCVLYKMALASNRKLSYYWPGIIGALIAWIIISVIFSYYVDNFARYSIIYGAVGTFIVLLIFLYFTAFIMIMGAEFNGVWNFFRENPDYVIEDPLK